MEGEFRSLTKRWEQAEELYNREKEVKRSLETPIELRISDDDDVPLTLAEYRAKHARRAAAGHAEYRSAYWHYLTVGNLRARHRGAPRALEGVGGRRREPRADRVLRPDHQHPAVHRADQPAREHDHDRQRRDDPDPVGVGARRRDVDGGERRLHRVGRDVRAGVARRVQGRPHRDRVGGAADRRGVRLDGYLAQELGESIGVLEETAYASATAPASRSGSRRPATA
jgi:hypothetical protein